MSHAQFWVNGCPVDASRYGGYHNGRIRKTLDTLRALGARKIMELGGHPWVMTAQLVESGAFEVCATVSAEEITKWPDDIALTRRPYHLKTAVGREARFVNYFANLERRLFDIEERPDTVVACEIVEHFIRAPHVMFLNINRWLPIGGKLLITTPNGAQFCNPFRRRSPTAGYRCYLYERHEYLFTREELVDLVSLCGFRILEASYWDVYERKGPSLLYGALAKIPVGYLHDKFQKTICVVAEKERAVAELSRCPRVYLPNPDWEYIAAPTKQADAAT